LLEQLQQQSSPEDLRYLRALRGLEQVGSAEAREVLTALVEGSPTAQRTQEARAALERVQRRR
jgi:hypothetical protein